MTEAREINPQSPGTLCAVMRFPSIAAGPRPPAGPALPVTMGHKDRGIQGFVAGHSEITDRNRRF